MNATPIAIRPHRPGRGPAIIRALFPGLHSRTGLR